MFTSTFIPLFLVAIDLITQGYSQYGHLWCHEGEKKSYNPAQCPAQTLECFKFICESNDTEFVARGCGVSLLSTAAGLPNESCNQALEMCQQVGGTGTCYTCGDKHMCNDTPSHVPMSIPIVLTLIGFLLKN
ncbi:hypothetical protein V3C99_010747 [Haemonchus contortus]